MAILSLGFATGVAPAPVHASDLDKAEKVIGSEGGKEALNTALRTAKTKPALAMAGAIVCLACLPGAGAAASPALCVACGILIAKVMG